MRRAGVLGVTGAWALGLALGAAAAAAEPDAGPRLFAERCSGCHGDDGRGDGPMAPALVPKPRDLRTAAFWRDRTDADLRTAVVKGKPGTMMPPFAGVLTDAEIDALVRFMRTFAPADAK